MVGTKLTGFHGQRHGSHEFCMEKDLCFAKCTPNQNLENGHSGNVRVRFWRGAAVFGGEGGKRVSASFEFFFLSFFLINNVSWLRVAELSHRAVSNHSSFPIVFGCMLWDARLGPSTEVQAKNQS